ncbi:hypothetical protein Acr_15g0013930 [Actinidia rufa]|uniref:Uncharacterized protein n=1 Tax=Actinidia rufa TaxID=165716 RepID=A0A7J0FVS8_9ERIC|nr:hypothetical protein Acr_15g0013930 [Actinidia rufa]
MVATAAKSSDSPPQTRVENKNSAPIQITTEQIHYPRG